MSVNDKRRILVAIILVGLIGISLVVMQAHAAEMRSTNNTLIAQNEELQGEVDTLNVKIQSACSIAHIEKVATEELGMVYPTSSNCIYLTENEAPEKNFAAVMRENAYN